jgi:aryl carrier-like protein
VTSAGESAAIDGWQTVRRVVAELLDVGETVLDADTPLSDLALDSIQLMQLRLFLEDAGVPAADLEVLGGRSLGQVADLMTATRTEPRYIGNRPRGEAVPAGDEEDLAPIVSGAGVSLVPLVARRHLDFLYSLAVDPTTGYRWRYRGEIITPERFQAEIAERVLIQCVVGSSRSGEPLGHVVAYQPNLRSGHTYVGAVFTPKAIGEGIGAVAVRLFVRYLFQIYPLRKVYLEVPDFNMDVLRSGLDVYLTPEGVLRGHDYYAGRHWDRHILAIYPGVFTS